MWDRPNPTHHRRIRLPQTPADPAGTDGARSGVFPMMTNERKIWEAALMLVRRHGVEAPKIAEHEARRLRSGGDELTCVVWCWIARATTELLRANPQKDERIH
jgi:hypothetical protein